MMSWNDSKTKHNADEANNQAASNRVNRNHAHQLAFRGILAGLIIIACSVAVIWLFSSGDDVSENPAIVTDSSTIAENSRLIESSKDSNGTEVQQSNQTTEDEILLQGKDTNEWIVVTNPYTGKKYLSKLMRPGLKNLPPPYFKNGALNILDALQYGEMGDPMIGVQIDGRFMNELEQAFVDGVEPDEKDDDDDRLAHKAAMRETLADLRQQLKDGADIREIIQDSLKERRRISALRDAMREERSRMRSEGATDEEVVEFERVCNKKLVDLGAKPMITKELMIKKGLERKGLLLNENE